MEFDGGMSISPCLDAPEWRAGGDVAEPCCHCQEDKSVTIGDEATGLARFQVTGREVDRDLIRSIARCLAEGGVKADRLRAAMAQAPEVRSTKGGIVAALLNSPLIGADLELRRDREAGRVADL
jgi:hypothetical protein